MRIILVLIGVNYGKDKHSKLGFKVIAVTHALSMFFETKQEVLDKKESLLKSKEDSES
jgi:hypothetical protein